MTIALPTDVRALVALSAALGGGEAPRIRKALERAANVCSPVATEETILQAYLFVGFPTVLGAMAEWRELSDSPPSDPVVLDRTADLETLERRGETLCRRIYGRAYETLRSNVARLHPDLDRWMVVEGYGKVLSRDGLAVETRELCIVALLAPTRHEPQLHSHLRGALNAGLSPAQVESTLRVAYEGMDDPAIRRAERVWDRVRDRQRLA